MFIKTSDLRPLARSVKIVFSQLSPNASFHYWQNKYICFTSIRLNFLLLEYVSWISIFTKLCFYTSIKYVQSIFTKRQNVNPCATTALLLKLLRAILCLAHVISTCSIGRILGLTHPSYLVTAECCAWSRISLIAYKFIPTLCCSHSS